MWVRSDPAARSPATTGSSSSTRTCGRPDATSLTEDHRNHGDLQPFVRLRPVVSTITQEPEVVQAPEPPEPPCAETAQAPPARACSSCGAALAPDQEWCLECGVGQPDRLGARPSWRTATAVLLTTGVLVAGAVGAAYAALNSDAKKAAAPNAQ